MKPTQKTYADFCGDRTPEPLTEDLNLFISKFRQKWYSSRSMRFRDWLGEFEDLLDLLD